MSLILVPTQADPSVTTSEWNVLGELEYVLRLCILEVREELPHYRIKVTGLCSVIVTLCWPWPLLTARALAGRAHCHGASRR